MFPLDVPSQSLHHPISIIFGRPFVKWFHLCYRTIVLSVCNVGVLWPNGWTDQDETWHAGRPQPWSHCVKWKPSSPHRSTAPLPNFRPISVATNGSMDQDATWYGGRPEPRRLCVRWGPRSPLPKRGQRTQNFQPILIVAKRPDRSRWYLAWR